MLFRSTQTGDGWQSGTTSASQAPTNMPKKAQTGKTYDVSYTIDPHTGLVDLITIKSN